MKDNIKVFIKKHKKDFVIFICVFIVLCLIYCNWFNKHYEIDNYVIENIGYNNYANNYFANSGRLMSSMFLKIGDILNINATQYNIFSLFLAIVILSITTVYLKKIIEKYKKCKTIFEEIILTIISFVTINNFFTISLMYFLESPILILSMLLFIMAADILIENKKKAILKSLILVTIGIFCYQATLSLFIAFAFLFSILKNTNKNKRENKNNSITKNIIKDFAKTILISIIAIGINFVIMKLIEIITTNSKIGRLSSITQIPENIINIITSLGEILYYNLGFYNEGLLLIILLLITIIVNIYVFKTKCENGVIKKYFAIMLYFIICSNIIFLFTRDSFYTGRMRIVLGSLIGVLFIYLYVVTNIFEYKKQSKKFEKIISATMILILASYLATTIYNYEININELLEVNKIDNKNADSLLENIYEYEKENDTKIENIYEVLIQDKVGLGYYEGTSMHPSALKTYDSASSIISKKLNRELKRTVIEEKDNKSIDIFMKNGYIILENNLFLPIYVW